MNFLQEMVGAVNPQAQERAEKIAQQKRQHEANLSTTKVPFGSPVHFEEDLSPDRSIMEVIVDMEITTDQFRSSSKLKEVLNEVVSSISLFHCWGKQSIKVRLSAFVKLLVSQLCVPHIMTLYGVGTTLFGAAGTDKQSEADLVGRGKRILVEAFTLFKLAEESILDTGDDSCLDKRRFHLFILLMELKCSPFLNHGLTIREHGGSALEALSCHILSVTAVTQCVHESIKIVVSRLTNTLTGETTTSTMDASRCELEILVLDYFAWLRGNYEQLVKMCRREEILTAVDVSTRAWLKAEAYSSPIEILSVYNQKYRQKLTHMAIPLQPYRSRDLEQARKDLVRETIVMNNVVYNAGIPTSGPSGSCSSSSGANSCSGSKPAAMVHTMVRCELRKVLAYLFEIDVFQAAEDGKGDDFDAATDLEGSASTSSSLNSVSTGAGACHSMELKLAAHRTPKSTLRKGGDSPRATRSNTVEDGAPGSSSGAVPVQQHDGQGTSATTAAMSSLASNPATSASAVTGAGTALSASYWEYELLDALYSYTILAASRTFAAGDAFLILNDLYGGEGLTFCPNNAPRNRTAPGTYVTSVSSAVAQPAKTVVDASIAILASGVKITLRERYNLYVSEEMARCVNRAKLRPLMRFECTTTTLLVLNHGVQALVPDTAADKRAACGRLFQTVISNPEHICHRAVTIEPFL